ncbi:MAG TPA: hypothetical protein VM716_12700 [Gemmatimonadales bacterium]|nr:hypothetical protein [Gemmatimonadales bacterium]
MRVYALLLGIVLTAGYTYPAEMAVDSLRTDRAVAHSKRPVVKDARGEVWYGGVLAPVTVLADGSATPKHGVVSRQTVRCPATSHSTFRAIS